ncbi:Beta-lactamase AST-1 precursor [compost metagenome]
MKKESGASSKIVNTTGDLRIRSGLPKDWKVGDKTGTNGHGAASGIAIVWPEGRGPLLIAVYIAEATVAVASSLLAVAFSVVRFFFSRMT